MTTLIAVEDELLRSHDLEELGVAPEPPTPAVEAIPLHRRQAAAALLRGMAAR